MLILFVYVLTTGAVMRGLRLFVSVPQNEAAVPFGAAPDNAHPALRVLGLGITSGADWVVALTALSVVVVAPVFEEFFFRVVIQGWFESVDARYRTRFLPFGFTPILVTSLFFAALHVRIGERDEGFEQGVLMLVATVLSSGLVMLLAICYLRIVRGATASDLGWRTDTFFADVRLGVVTACAILGPLFGIQAFFLWVLPKHVAPDPVPIFVLSVVLGFLYLRTHRAIPGIVLHFCLNLVSLAMAVLAFQAGRM